MAREDVAMSRSGAERSGAERNGNVKIAREDVAMFITDPLRSVGKSLINI